MAIGITAGSFVVFERLRDEMRDGRSLRAAVERGWGRARRTILVSDTVSFLAAALLYYFAIGSVRGFAFTLLTAGGNLPPPSRHKHAPRFEMSMRSGS